MSLMFGMKPNREWFWTSSSTNNIWFTLFVLEGWRNFMDEKVETFPTQYPKTPIRSF